MFLKAIREAQAYTRPFLSISRHYESKEVQPGASTLILVNDEGWALTCKHVAELMPGAEQINRRYANFKAELASPPRDVRKKNHLRAMEHKYGMNSEALAQLRNQFVDCTDTMTGFQVIPHPDYDVALIQFQGFATVTCGSYPRFPKDTSGLQPGKTICRLGFPFVEFTNFEYDEASDDIRWTTTGRVGTPFFPLDGMVTRHVVNGPHMVGFELSTPGLRGQSGGPAFDVNGVVWGMQALTRHLDLNFDVDQEVVRGGKQKRVRDHAFLHVGFCVHADILKDMMRQHGVKFHEV